MEQPPKQKRVQQFGEYKGPKGVRYVDKSRPTDIGMGLQVAENVQAMKKPLLVPLHFPKQSELSGATAKMAAQVRANHAFRMFQLNPKGFRSFSLKKDRPRMIGFVEKRFNEAAAFA